MQIGFNAPISGHLIRPESLLQIVTEGEALGFDHLTLGDHIMVPRDLESKYPYSETGEFPPGPKAAWLEQLATTAFIAAATKKIRFVLSVLVVPHRPAVLTAKLLATIDFLSNGRLTVGIGVGWCREEFQAIGAAPFDDRGYVTDEWMEVCKTLWTQAEPKFAGKYVSFENVAFEPKPVQQPIPIWVGGESGPALRRTARYANGWYPVGTNPNFPLRTVGQFKTGLARLHRHCGQAGRNPTEITLALRVTGVPDARPRETLEGEPELFKGDASDWIGDIKVLEDLGVSAIDVRLFGATAQASVDMMRRFRQDVMDKVR